RNERAATSKLTRPPRHQKKRPDYKEENRSAQENGRAKTLDFQSCVRRSAGCSRSVRPRVGDEAEPGLDFGPRNRLQGRGLLGEAGTVAVVEEPHRSRAGEEYRALVILERSGRREGPAAMVDKPHAFVAHH